MIKLIFIITNLAYIIFLFTTVYSCPQKKTGGAAAPSAPPVPAPLARTKHDSAERSDTLLVSHFGSAFAAVRVGW